MVEFGRVFGFEGVPKSKGMPEAHWDDYRTVGGVVGMRILVCFFRHLPKAARGGGSCGYYSVV